MTIGKFFTLATVFVAAFTFGSCSKDDDEEENNSKSDNHEYVDLGLPSGTLWATCNVGANKPEEYGDHFAWGETKPKEVYSWSNYKWMENNMITRYCIESNFEGSHGTVDNKTELLPEDDAATANWGSSWCLPSINQIQELLSPDNTTREFTTQNGVYGVKIISKKNSKSIFLPAAGYYYEGLLDDYAGSVGFYMSRSLSIGSLRAYNLSFWATSIGYGDTERFKGQSARPVRK